MPTEIATEEKRQYLESNLDSNVEYLNRLLGVKESFDMICRRLRYAGKAFALYFVDGFAKDDIMNRLMDHLADLNQGALSVREIQRLLQTHIAYLEVETVKEVGQIVDAVLSGPLVLLIDGETEAIVIDARTYPARGPAEPDTERVVRGARDGFTETFVFNTALTRRRIRDPRLRFEYIRVGARSKTDMCLAYIKDVANPDLVNILREELKKVEIDGLPMAEKTVEELVFKQNWNPYPMIRYTERPDVAAVHLLEGHVLIYVDTSPSVIITPTTFFHHVQHAEEYRQKPVVGAYLRWIRLLAILGSIVVPPLWLAFVLSPGLVPEAFGFVIPENLGRFHLFWQLLIAELGIDVLRMAAIHTPSPVATAMGLVAAVILGEIAVDVGFFIKEVVLYIAIAAVGNYATPSYEFALANRLVRLGLLVITSVFSLFGFGLLGLVSGLVLWFVMLARTRSLETPYLWPLLPFNGKALVHVLMRTPILWNKKRPEVLNPLDRTSR
ncbi:spore germination protein [Effusibacillus lacus]|uniref:Spore germination protein n=1 Tax=Effusibacillus lacus TaxID=1348429 RepID=A0A292YRP8_9BACL|nr:spore germination protein [Effusibacillus lacus]TCS70078.1 stage V sporulation protein AF [Effusibacillus lacus]GAX91084.1 spore germination protein [Effusibacillus lacus]